MVSGIWWAEVVEAFRLLRFSAQKWGFSTEVFEEIDLESSGVRQKNSSSADDDSPNLPNLLIFLEELLELAFPPDSNDPICY